MANWKCKTVGIFPDSYYIATISLDMSTYVWETTTGYLVGRLGSPDSHKDNVYEPSKATR